MKYIIITIGVLLSGAVYSQGIQHSQAGTIKEETKTGSYLVESRSIRDVITGGYYDDLGQMRADRRVGIGIETFGRLGTVGLDFELNYTPSDAALVGIGGGAGYNTMSIGWKHQFGDSEISPYFSINLARWSSSAASGFDGSSPKFLEDHFLTATEKATGRFSHFFLSPAVGMQFYQLEGQSAGASLFAEILLMAEASTMDQVPAGALGALYYF